MGPSHSTRTGRATRGRASTQKSPRLKTQKRTYGSRARRLRFELPIRPSYVLLALGALMLAWQLGLAQLFPDTGRWIPRRASGVVGLMVVICGLGVMWMESLGLRRSK